MKEQKKVKKEKMTNKIILTAKTELIDKIARQQISMLWTKIETLNERTKKHTHYIKELEKKNETLFRRQKDNRRRKT